MRQEPWGGGMRQETGDRRWEIAYRRQVTKDRRQGDRRGEMETEKGDMRQ